MKEYRIVSDHLSDLVCYEHEFKSGSRVKDALGVFHSVKRKTPVFPDRHCLKQLEV